MSAPDPAEFRAQFPVFERLAYLNAGTEGPVPRQAADAAHRRIDAETTGGRSGRAYFDELIGLASELRSGYARLLGADPDAVALTGSTTDGVNTVLSGLDLRPGDEILTTDEEHPGLLAPLGRARRRWRISVRVVPFAELAGEVSLGTRLVACSHVSWVGGRVADTAALRATGVPVLLDAAQALGAIPVDVGALGCDYYAASGQKWLCGPEGSGCLYVRPERLEELLVPWPGYASVADPGRALELEPGARAPRLAPGRGYGGGADPGRALELEPAAGARRLDHGFPAGVRTLWARTSLEVLERAGWSWVHERAASLAEGLARRLAELGLVVCERGRSTLVSWLAADAQAEVERLAGEGFVVRSIPGLGLVRASVGAWSSEEELEALAQAASRP